MTSLGSRSIHISGLLVGTLILSEGCSFNFELTGQKTALENQIMGSYKELDDDSVMLASVRGVDASGKKKVVPKLSDPQKEALAAKQNQDFNRDDIDEFKSKQIIGETKDGHITFLPKNVGLQNTLSKEDEKFGAVLIEEENRDRETIFKRVVSSNENLSAKDLEEVRRTYAKKQATEALPGHWIEGADGVWKRTISEKENK